LGARPASELLPKLMPSIPYPLALIQLWIASSALPWSNPVWQSLTNVLGDPWTYDRGRDVTAASTHVAEWTVGKAQAIEVFMVVMYAPLN
jgi:hypothetical protein